MSRLIPYSPMHEPRKEVSFERMQEILRKHARIDTVPEQSDSSPIPKVEETPKAELPKLEWAKPTSRDQMALLTKCGRYSCCKVILNGRTTYECWVLVPGVWFAQVAIGLPSFAKAQEIAQKHFESKQGKP